MFAPGPETIGEKRWSFGERRWLLASGAIIRYPDNATLGRCEADPDAEEMRAAFMIEREGAYEVLLGWAWFPRAVLHGEPVGER